jgi:hypothetical protein
VKNNEHKSGVSEPKQIPRTWVKIMKKAMLLIFVVLMIGSVSAQNNFKTIDFRGKTSSEVPKLCYENQFLACAHNWVDENWKPDPKGEEVMTFRGYDFQNVWYQFNKKGICYKIIIRNNVGKPIVFDESVIYTVAWENGVVIYTIEK